jgi:hypothetical protein|tara:strand:+ start:734 stop:895 length:162 start_codon:yes stop_codon:yes gene_type:complete
MIARRCTITLAGRTGEKNHQLFDVTHAFWSLGAFVTDDLFDMCLHLAQLIQTN